MVMQETRVPVVEVEFQDPWYEFKVGSFCFYDAELDIGRLNMNLLSGGYAFEELQPIINEVTERYTELQMPAQTSDDSDGDAPAKNVRSRAPRGRSAAAKNDDDTADTT